MKEYNIAISRSNDGVKRGGSMNIVLVIASVIALPIVGALVMNAIDVFDDWMEDRDSEI